MIMSKWSHSIKLSSMFFLPPFKQLYVSKIFSSEFKPKKIKTENDKKAKKRKQDEVNKDWQLYLKSLLGLHF